MTNCHCGLTYEALLAVPSLVGVGGVCTAFRKGSRSERCGELLADHPHEDGKDHPFVSLI